MSNILYRILNKKDSAFGNVHANEIQMEILTKYLPINLTFGILVDIAQFYKLEGIFFTYNNISFTLVCDDDKERIAVKIPYSELTVDERTNLYNYLEGLKTKPWFRDQNKLKIDKE